MFYTLPQAIKEEKEDEEGFWRFEIRKERRLGKLKVKKRNEREGSEGFGFLVFHFLSKGNRERIL